MAAYDPDHDPEHPYDHGRSDTRNTHLDTRRYGYNECRSRTVRYEGNAGNCLSYLDARDDCRDHSSCYGDITRMFTVDPQDAAG